MANRNKFPVTAACVLTALILLYMGLFLFGGSKETDTAKQQIETTAIPVAAVQEEMYVKHTHISKTINGKKQEINMLEVNPDGAGVRIVPVLSHDLVYGYETLSSIFTRKNAYAAINAGFFYDYGLPGGMVAADGRVFTMPTGKYPIFAITGGKASLGLLNLKFWLEHEGSRYKLNKLNMPLSAGEYAVYTPVYGATNRAEGENYTIIVKDGTVTEARWCKDETEIPKGGMLVTLMGDSPAFSPQKGDKLELLIDPPVPSDIQAYECGSWIVKDGIVVIGEKDAWIGVTTNNDPRTVIGIKDDGTVVLLTVDGRQPGYSEGMKCKELGEFLLTIGIRNAALLDGGASTEMIKEGKIVNKPSFKGQERPVGGGMLVILNGK